MLNENILLDSSFQVLEYDEQINVEGGFFWMTGPLPFIVVLAFYNGYQSAARG